MPYKDPERQRKAVRESARRRRAKLRAGREATAQEATGTAAPWPSDPAAAIAEWSRSVLRVPDGHPLEGQPLELPPFGIDFLADVFKHSEALLLVARKNAKSSIIAVLFLAALLGPIRRKGWRGAVCSLNKGKANELIMLMEGMVTASPADLHKQITFRRTPYPGSVRSAFGTVEVLAAERISGHSSGYDFVALDELGMLQERDRPLIAGLRSSVSAKAGRFVALTIHGDGPFVPEILARASDPAVTVHHFAAKPDCRLDDPKAWAMANPGLGTIKDREYMKVAARRALACPADQPGFRAHELNLPGDPESHELILTKDQLQNCIPEDPPARGGPCTIGIDLGSSVSQSSVALFWAETKRLEVYGAFGDVPSLLDRGESDGVGGRYQEMFNRGELWVFEGLITPLGKFIESVAEVVGDAEVIGAAADSFKASETEQAMLDAGVCWPVDFRRKGAGKQGFVDIREFQRAAMTGGVQLSSDNLLFKSAVLEGRIVRDANGNASFEKKRTRGRIDPVDAAILAVGLGKRLVLDCANYGEAIFVSTAELIRHKRGSLLLS